MNQGSHPEFSTRPPVVGDDASARPRIRRRGVPHATVDRVHAPVSQELRERLCRAAAPAAAGEAPSFRWAALAPAARQAIATVGVGVTVAVHRVTTPDWHVPCLLVAGLALGAVAAHDFTGIRLRDVLTMLGLRPADGDLDLSPRRRGRGTAALLTGLACLVPVVWAAGTALAVLAATGLGYAVLFTRAIPAAYRSQAETVGRVGLAVTAVAATYYVLGGGWTVDVFTAGLQLGLVASVAGAVNSIRDLAGDRRMGRRTVTARWGVPVGRYLVTILCMVPFTLGLCWLLAGGGWAAGLPFLAAPLAWLVIRDVHVHIPGHLLEPAVTRAGWLHLAFAALLAVGLIL